DRYRRLRHAVGCRPRHVGIVDPRRRERLAPQPPRDHAAPGAGENGHDRHLPIAGERGMNVLWYLIPISLALGGLGLALFFWALKSGQYEDVSGAAERILNEDDRPL